MVPVKSRALFWLPLAFILLLGGCLGSSGEQAADADSTATAQADSTGDEKAPQKEKAIRVNVGEVRLGDLVQSVYADGAISTPKSVEMKTKVGGEFTTVNVRDGDHVRRGQVLARIDPREYEIALRESRYKHLQALSQMAAEDDTFVVNDRALSDFADLRDELQTLRSKGGITEDEYTARLLALEMGALNKGAFRDAVFEQRTGLADARMAEERARLNLENTEIKAPFSGVIQGLNVVQGEMASVGQSVCTVSNNSSLEARVNVLEDDLRDLETGRPVLLAIPATGDTLQVKVDVISPSLDQATRTCEILIRFENPEERYRPGMFVRARIAGEVNHDRFLVPKNALLIRDDRPLVFKVNEDRAQWLYVDTGLQNEDWVEITGVHSGGTLVAGDEVVVSDHLTLAHEAKIKIHDHIPPHDRWSFAFSEEDKAP